MDALPLPLPAVPPASLDAPEVVSRPLTGLWSRERLLRDAGFDPTADLRRAVKSDRRALGAVRPLKRTRTLIDGRVKETIEDGGAPDWPTRLEASRHMYALAGIYPESRAAIEATFNAPVVIQWRSAPAPVVGDAEAKAVESSNGSPGARVGDDDLENL